MKESKKKVEGESERWKCELLLGVVEKESKKKMKGECERW